MNIRVRIVQVSLHHVHKPQDTLVSFTRGNVGDFGHQHIYTPTRASANRISYLLDNVLSRPIVTMGARHLIITADRP